MPRFALLTHDHPTLHWDLLLEQPGVTHEYALRAWRLMDEPQAGQAIPAEPLPDHRRKYLDYEGPVGGGRGRVVCWDRGEYSVVAASDLRLEVRLAGQRLVGRATVESDSSGDATFVYWLD